MNTEKHYASGGEDHYKRVKRLGLSWCRANITKYAERTKATPVEDLMKIIDYAAMELEDLIFTSEQLSKLRKVAVRVADLISTKENANGNAEDREALRAYVGQGGGGTNGQGLRVHEVGGDRHTEDVRKDQRAVDPGYVNPYVEQKRQLK